MRWPSSGSFKKKEEIGTTRIGYSGSSMTPGPSSPRGRRRRLAAVISVFAVANLSSVSSASVGSQLHTARAKLAALTEQIRGQEAQAVRLQDNLTALDARLANATTRAKQIHAGLSLTRTEIEAARAQQDMLQQRLDRMARGAFMSGAGNPIADFVTLVLGSSSLKDVYDRLAYISSVSQAEVALADHVANSEARLAIKASGLGRLLQQQTTILAQLAAERRAQARVIARQREALTNLDRTRNRILQLVAKLKRQLRAEELAVIAASFQGNNNAPYGQWAGLFLTTMQLPACHSNMIALVAWQVSEFTQAAWNPLATTRPMSGSTTFNSAGVQNFVSIDQGLLATQQTIADGLVDHGYGAIVDSLKRCADPMTTAVAINASDWCRGCSGGAYVTDNVGRVEANYSLYAAL